MPKSVLNTLLLMFLLSQIGCASYETNKSPEDIPELAPGILMGYLPLDPRIDSKLFVPPAPASDSARQAMDDAVVKEMLALQGTPRWDLATKDARLYFPPAAETFACALGMPITEATSPELYLLLRRTLADLALAARSAKELYQRERPFMANGYPSCTPDEEARLRDDPSYPSGHTAIGWGWALILSELAPERAEVILNRGRVFGESRNVCNVHWRSDVIAGRMVGAAAVARLHSNKDFMRAMAASETEIVNARALPQPSNPDCLVEAQALEITQ